MVSSIVRFCAIGLALLATARAIDLTPKTAVRELEGVRFTELRFSDGASEISYSPPTGWTWVHDDDGLTFKAPDIAQAEAKLDVSPMVNAYGSFDGPTRELLKLEFSTFLPRGGSQVTIVTDRKDPIMINGHESYEVIFAYNLYGQHFQTSVLVAQIGNERMKVQITSREKDFTNVYGAFQRSLFSWQWLKSN